MGREALHIIFLNIYSFIIFLFIGTHCKFSFCWRMVSVLNITWLGLKLLRLLLRHISFYLVFIRKCMNAGENGFRYLIFISSGLRLLLFNLVYFYPILVLI